MNIKTSMHYVNNQAIEIGIARLVPMRVEINLPWGADWKTPYDKLDRMFLIHQYAKDDKGRYVVPFGSHDLHFWCACNPDYTDDYYNVHLSFNEKKSVEDRKSDLDRLIKALNDFFTEGEATIQYRDEIDEQAAHEMAERRFKELQGKRVTCPNRDSIIIFGGAEPVGTLIRFNGEFGKPFAFKKLRSRKYVFPRSDVDVCFAKEVPAR